MRRNPEQPKPKEPEKKSNWVYYTALALAIGMAGLICGKDKIRETYRGTYHTDTNPDENDSVPETIDMEITLEKEQPGITKEIRREVDAGNDPAKVAELALQRLVDGYAKYVEGVDGTEEQIEETPEQPFRNLDEIIPVVVETLEQVGFTVKHHREVMDDQNFTGFVFDRTDDLEKRQFPFAPNTSTAFLFVKDGKWDRKTEFGFTIRRLDGEITFHSSTPPATGFIVIENKKELEDLVRQEAEIQMKKLRE